MNHLAFVQAIRDDPDDDLPRLAYADWFEEQGDAARGEMIRLQIELRRGCPDRGRELVLLRRLRELAVTHRRRWLGTLLEVAPDAVFERGFVEELSLPARVFLRRGAALLVDHPVTRLRLTEAPGAMGDLGGCSGLASVAELSLRRVALNASDVMSLAGSPHLGRLRSLDLRGCQVTAAGLEALLVSQRLPRLARLDLSYNQIGDGLGTLLGLPGLPSLRRINLSGNGISGRMVASLGRRSWLSRLQSLGLANNELSEADVEQLASSPHLAGLEELILCPHRLTAEALQRLRERYGPRLVI